MEKEFNENIEQEVEKTLSSWQNEKAPTAGPDFFDAVMAKVEATEETRVVPIRRQNTWLKVAAAVVLLLVNATTIVQVMDQASSTTASRDSQLDQLVEEFQLESTNDYNF